MNLGRNVDFFDEIIITLPQGKICIFHVPRLTETDAIPGSWLLRPEFSVDKT